METRANYLLVGIFVLVFSAGLLVFALWLGRAQFEIDVKRYDIYFVGPVTGLKKGSFVSYRGITVGEVVELEIDPTNLQRVRVTIEVKSNTPIRQDTVASIEIQGIAGAPFILLSGGTERSPPLKLREGQRYPVIASVPSKIEQVLQSAPAAVEHINLLLARANELLSPENRLAISNTLKNFDTLTQSLAAQSPEIEKSIQEFSGTMANLREATERLDRVVADADTAIAAVGRTAENTNKTVNAVGDEIGPLLADLRQTSKSMTAMANEISGMVAENREPLRNFSGTALVDLTTLIDETRQLVAQLDRVTTEIERDPARFFFGNRNQGYDATKNK